VGITNVAETRTVQTKPAHFVRPNLTLETRDRITSSSGCRLFGFKQFFLSFAAVRAESFNFTGQYHGKCGGRTRWARRVGPRVISKWSYLELRNARIRILFLRQDELEDQPPSERLISGCVMELSPAGGAEERNTSLNFRILTRTPGGIRNWCAGSQEAANCRPGAAARKLTTSFRSPVLDSLWPLPDTTIRYSRRVWSVLFQPHYGRRASNRWEVIPELRWRVENSFFHRQ